MRPLSRVPQESSSQFPRLDGRRGLSVPSGSGEQAQTHTGAAEPGGQLRGGLWFPISES